MDAQFKKLPTTPMMKIAGLGWVGPHGLERESGNLESLETVCDVVPYLKDPKSLKLMAKQDRLALFAAGRAVKDAGLDTESLRDQCGVYLTVGILAFEQEQLDLLAQRATSESGSFDMKRCSTEAFHALNPVLTFRCLPNMPAFHISVNLGIQNTYYITYPGAGQWYQVLKKAYQDLSAGRVRYALVGAVADRRNALVRYHVERVNPEELPLLIDTACVWVLTLEAEKNFKSYGTIDEIRVNYQPTDPLKKSSQALSSTHLKLSSGPVDPALFLTFKLLQTSWNDPKISICTKSDDGVNGALSVMRRQGD